MPLSAAGALRGAQLEHHTNSSRQNPPSYMEIKSQSSGEKNHRRVRAGTTSLIQCRRRARLVTHIP